MKRIFGINLFWSTGASWIEQATAALVFLLIARIIGVEAFGIASLAFAFLFLGEILVRDTLTESIVERETIEDGRLEATFFVLVTFALVLVACLWAIALTADFLFEEPGVGALLMAGSPTVLLIAGAGVSTALLRRRMAYRTLAIRTVAGVMSGGAVGITLALNGFGPWSLVGQRLTEISVNSILAFAAAGWVPRRLPRRGDYSYVQGLGPQVVRLRAISLVIAQSPTVLLGMFMDARIAGQFAFALRLTEIVLTIAIKPLQGVSQSAIAEMRRQGQATAQFFLEVTELAILNASVCLLGLALIASPLIGALLGPSWHLTASILPWLCAAGIGIALAFVQEGYLLAHDSMKKFVQIALLEAAIGLVLVIAAATIGPILVGAAILARTAIVFPFRIMATFEVEHISLRDLFQAARAPLLVSSFLFLAVFLVQLALGEIVSEFVLVVISVATGIVAVALSVTVVLPDFGRRLMEFVRA